MGPDPPYGIGPGPGFDGPAGRHLERGRLLLDKGRRAEALDAFRHAAQCDPRSYFCPWRLMPHLEAEGRAHLPSRMRARVKDWHRGDPPEEVATLARLAFKPRVAQWARANGFRVPRRIARAPALTALDLAALPDRFVLKPVNGATSAGVILFDGGVDLYRQRPVGPDLRAYAGAVWRVDGVANAPAMVEEAIRDVDRHRDPLLAVPRDVKVFCVGGQAVFFRVFDRNAPDQHRSRATFDRYGAWIDDPSPDWPLPEDRRPPTGFEDAVAEADRASRLFPWLVRFDFFPADDGPVLGEVTTNPNAGIGFEGIIRRAVFQMWEAYPDPARG